MNHKKRSTFCIFFIAAAYLTLPVIAAELVDKIVAIVNDEIITHSELEESMLAFVADYQVRYGPEAAGEKLDEAKSDALNRLIEEKLILQEARRLEVTVEEGKIEKRLEDVKSKFPSEKEFEDTLKKSGMSVEKLKNKYRDQMMMRVLVNAVVSQNAKVTPTQIASYYYGHKDEFKYPEKVKFRIILIKYKPGLKKTKTRSLTRNLLNRIRAGEDFGELAKEYSEGPNAEDGGDMNFIARGDMLKEINDVIFSLSEGEVSGVIETSLGCNIIKVGKKMQAYEMSLEEARSSVTERLYSREAELVFREFLDNLKKDAYIDIK